ncbi:MAG: ABC transporter ATP-binding protein [Planctomycetes bacterium]|nr:ABC transporter ATP-binding protein [Planctomycetota bacterium]MCK5579508.1 ABC transporter ATP-binding protein [Planctomycetota bacterium]
MEEKIVIEINNLTKVYTSLFSRFKVKAVDNLSLTIRSGEVFGLLGPNGSGKTTTIKTLLGLIFPTSGEALVLGKSPREVAVKDRIGFLPEESYLYPFLTAEETLDFYGQIFKIPLRPRRKKIDELLELMELNHARKRPVKEYSKGMARRLGFAQAIINDPDVIFLDEPTSGLDPVMSRHVKNIIIDLKKKGKTILLSSHLLADVENVCDRLAILHKGRLQKVGSVKELLSQDQISNVTLKGLTPELQEKLKKMVTQAGAEVVNVQLASDTLETLFLRTIKEDPDEKNSGGDQPDL